MIPKGKPAGKLGAGRNPKLQAGRMILAKIKKRPVATKLATQQILDKLMEISDLSQVGISGGDQIILSDIQQRIAQGGWRPTDHVNAQRILDKFNNFQRFSKLRK